MRKHYDWIDFPVLGVAVNKKTPFPKAGKVLLKKATSTLRAKNQIQRADPFL